jgi:hypothetical protein
MEERRERPARDGAPRRRISPRAVLAAVLLVLLVAFVLDNTREVRVGYVIGDATMPLIIVLVVTAVVGGPDRVAHAPPRPRPSASGRLIPPRAL